LLGGPTEADRKSYSCDVPASVLIRVRAVFMRPTGLSPDPRAPWQAVARGTIATGSLAVATMPGRKPIFFASATHAAGTAEAFVAPSRCSPT
jgi:hypothetical protein